MEGVQCTPSILPSNAHCAWLQKITIGLVLAYVQLDRPRRLRVSSDQIHPHPRRRPPRQNQLSSQCCTEMKMTNDGQWSLKRQASSVSKK